MEEVLEDTQRFVKRWLDLDAEIKALTKALNDRRKEKKQVTEKIIGFMTENDVPFFNLNQQGKLSLKESIAKTPLNQKMIKTTIESLLSSTDAERLHRVLFDERPSVSKLLLKYRPLK